MKSDKKNNFYFSKKWRKLRETALNLYDRKCHACGISKNDCETPLHVDHIKPKSLFPHLSLDITNLQILCEECNLEKSNIHSTDYRSQEDIELAFNYAKKANQYSTFLKERKFNSTYINELKRRKQQSEETISISNTNIYDKNISYWNDIILFVNKNMVTDNKKIKLVNKHLSIPLIINKPIYDLTDKEFENFKKSVLNNQLIKSKTALSKKIKKGHILNNKQMLIINHDISFFKEVLNLDFIDSVRYEKYLITVDRYRNIFGIDIINDFLKEIKNGH